MTAAENPKAKGPTFTITVDGEPLDVTEHELTPAEIMRRVGLDPDTHYLVERRGKEQISLQGKSDDPIRVHEHLTLVSVFTGPTPVS